MKDMSLKYNDASPMTDSIIDDSTHYLRSGGTICWRFFNPSNIRP